MCKLGAFIFNQLPQIHYWRWKESFVRHPKKKKNHG